MFFFNNRKLVGYVSSVNAPITVGKIKTYEVMKFLITNKNKRMIQCSAWNDEIEKVKNDIKVGTVSI